MKQMILGGTAALLSLSLVLTGCGSEPTGTSESSGGSESVSIGEHLKYEVIGIEARSGIHALTEQAFIDYGMKDWKLVEGSSAGMVKAYEKNQPIVVMGWMPHWKFSKFDLKFLDQRYFR
ncbi:glycine betaine ABC transporter substrate-binding protein [Ammoniphilus sp. 3BR4]|uniref:glycine betaine ABC transporter substrate-binding protein n=1 Tax=Ammoniphilus sp. 3BR4 TaxID=3158265 RepID=UPI003464ECA1